MARLRSRDGSYQALGYLRTQLPPTPPALIQAPNGPRISHLLSAIRAPLGQPPGRRGKHRSAARRDLSDHADRWPPSAADRRPARHPWRCRAGIHAGPTSRDRLRSGCVAWLLCDPPDCLRSAAGRSAHQSLRTDDAAAVANGGPKLLATSSHVRKTATLAGRFQSGRSGTSGGDSCAIRRTQLVPSPDCSGTLRWKPCASAGHERIDRAMLDRVRTESPAMIETLATSDRF